MATLLWQRDLSSDINGVEQTYSSWDSCMSKAYCKWPAIIGIIIGVLVVLSILSCLARCLCCGLECCCGICSCCNACCPSPRRRRRGMDDGYYPAPAPPPSQPAYPPAQQYPQYPQYQSPAPPTYGQPSAYRSTGPQTATFDTQTKGVTAQKVNEDALPAMPTWSSATDKHVMVEEEVEMEKLDQTDAQAQYLLPSHNSNNDNNSRYYGHQDTAGGDLGAMGANPYHDYDHHQQFVPSPVSTAHNSMYPPTYHTSPTSTMYEPAQQQWGGGYAPSIAPSYHTQAPSYGNSPPPQHQQQQGAGIMRKPLQGTWREV